MTDEWTESGFERWRELGFESDYAAINPKEKTIKPAWDADDLLGQGFLPKGSKVRFINKNGYDSERARAAEAFGTDEVLVVATCNIGDSSSNYTFYDRDGKWNTVMFEAIAL